MNIPVIEKIESIKKFENYLDIRFSTGMETGKILMDGDDICFFKTLGLFQNRYMDIGNQQIKDEIIRRLRLKLLFGNVCQLNKMTQEMILYQTLKEKKPFLFSKSSIPGECIIWSKGSGLYDGLHTFLNRSDIQTSWHILQYGAEFKSILSKKSHPFIEIDGTFEYEGKQFAITNIEEQNNETKDYKIFCNEIGEHMTNIITFHFRDKAILNVLHTKRLRSSLLNPAGMNEIISFINQFREKISN